MSALSSIAGASQGVLLDIQQLNAHECWVQMSWEARGMALALMGMPMDEAYAGTLPPETDAWRNALGLPSARVMNSVRDRTLGMKGSRALNELDQAWAVWLEELMLWFKPIDDEFIAQHPHWSGHKGRWWYPLLENTVVVAKPKKGAKKKASQSAVGKDTSAQSNPSIETPAVVVAKTAKKPKAKSKTKLPVEPALDYPPIRLTGSKLRQCWDEPLSSELRTQLWDAGVRAIGGNESTARNLLGSLIKQYGEQVVAEAVAKLAVRASRPADPVAFLRKQVIIQAGDDPKAQKARSKRTQVAI